jgi:hypothetical protein
MENNFVAILNEALAAADKYLGFPEPRARAIAKRLTESGLLPAGGPGRSPELDDHGFVRLLIALAVNDRLRRADDVVRTYSELAPGGASLEGAPDSITRTAFEQIAILAAIAIHGDADAVRSVRKAKLEFVSSWPEIAIYEYGPTVRFRPPGALAATWGDNKQRTSTTINGAAFVDAIQELFGA